MSSIFIPTYRKQKVTTLACLPTTLLDRVVLIVESRAEGKRLTKEFSVKWCVSPSQGTGVHNVRQWLMSRCRKAGQPLCIMIDDDLRFKIAKFEEGKKRFRNPLKAEELVKPFSLCEEKALAHMTGMASFSQAFFNTTREIWEQNKDNASTYFVNVDVASKSKARFYLPSVDDCAFMLETVLAGYELWSLSTVATVKVGKQGGGGEASVGDRGRRHEDAIFALVKRFPKYVSSRKTTNKAYRENYGTDTMIVKRLAAMWKAVKAGKEVEHYE